MLLSTQGIREFRPRLHFTPEKGWINDPNGMVYADGVYHLFYQYYPGGTVWGPMHWGHAVSRDLCRWEHLPTALYPDTDGEIYSGSAVLDENNSSGFGMLGKAPLVAIYTQHMKNGESYSETQNLAYSLDGIHFEKYEGNPVLVNEVSPDFRDPKVFPHPSGEGWCMAIAVHDCVQFYESRNLKEWNYTGEFGHIETLSHAVWECPDLIPLPCGERGVWVLIASMEQGAEYGGSRTLYFVGEFDGKTFHAEGSYRWLDEGFDNYAGVTWSGTERKIFIGWESNWRYGASLPTGDWCGMMTLPRVLSAVEVPGKEICLGCQVTGLAERFKDVRLLTEKKYDFDGNFQVKEICGKKKGYLKSETFALQIKGNGPCSVALVNSRGQRLRFGIDAENQLFVDRREAGDDNFSEIYASESYGFKSVPRLFDGEYVLEAVFDVCSLELFADKGTLCMTQLVFPDEPYRYIEYEGEVEIRIVDLSE